MKKRYLLSAVILISPVVLAGNIEPTQEPTTFSSYSIKDICNRLENGTMGTSSTFTEPTSGPDTPTGCTLNEVMSKAPTKDNTNGAVPSDVAKDKKYWGITDGNWGIKTGTGYIATYPAPVHQTGESGSAGVAWPNPRFTVNTTLDSNNDGDCDDEGETCAGTVTDNFTGLIWLQNANCTELPKTDDEGRADWETAKIAASELTGGICGLPSEYQANDWRVPSINELQSIVHYGFYEPAIPNTAGTAKWTNDGDPFVGVQFDYWSSSVEVSDREYAWYVNVDNGSTYFYPIDDPVSVWPVRGGQ